MWLDFCFWLFTTLWDWNCCVCNKGAGSMLCSLEVASLWNISCACVGSLDLNLSQSLHLALPDSRSALKVWQIRPKTGLSCLPPHQCDWLSFLTTPMQQSPCSCQNNGSWLESLLLGRKIYLGCSFKKGNIKGISKSCSGRIHEYRRIGELLTRGCICKKQVFSLCWMAVSSKRSFT